MRFTFKDTFHKYDITGHCVYCGIEFDLLNDCICPKAPDYEEEEK